MTVTDSARMSPRKGAWRSSALFFLDGFLIGVLFIRFGNPVVHKPADANSNDAAVVENIDVRDLLAAQHDYGVRHPSWRARVDETITYPEKLNRDYVLKLDSRSLERTLINTIEDSVAPDSWIDAGGSVGLISLNDGVLIIVQTPQNLQQIHQLLGDLKEDVTEWPQGQTSREVRQQP